MSNRAFAALIAAVTGLISPDPGWSVECATAKGPEAQAKWEQVLARHQQQTRTRKPIDTSVVHLGREDIYTVLREIQQKEEFGFAPNVTDDALVFGFNVAPVSAREPFLPTFAGDEWICLLPMSIGVYLSDGFVWHVSQVYRFDPQQEMVWFADTWPDNFLLAEGRNALGIKAMVREGDGVVLHGVSLADAKRVITGAILAASRQEQLEFMLMISLMAAGREKVRTALELGAQYRGAPGAVRLLMARNLEAVSDSERRMLESGLDVEDALGGDYAAFEGGRGPLANLCTDTVLHIGKALSAGVARAAAFPLIRIAGPVATYCKTGTAQAALSRLAEALPDEIEPAYWAARAAMASGRQDEAEKFLAAAEKLVADTTDRMLDPKVGDKVSYLRATPVETPSYNLLRFWDREVRRIRIAALARADPRAGLGLLDGMASDVDWRDFSLASEIFRRVGAKDEAFSTVAAAMARAEGPVVSELARQTLIFYPAARDSEMKQRITNQLSELKKRARSRNRIYEATLYDSLFPDRQAAARTK